jgi:DNA-binding NarL/FixJ family response regulator
VVVVDDQELFRAVMRDVVHATPDMELAGEAASGEAAVDAVQELSPQLVIIDKRMPGIGGIETARRIAARRPGVMIVLVSIEAPRAETLDSIGPAVAFLDKRRVSPRALAELWRSRET